MGKKGDLTRSCHRGVIKKKRKTNNHAQTPDACAGKKGTQRGLNKTAEKTKGGLGDEFVRVTY